MGTLTACRSRCWRHQTPMDRQEGPAAVTCLPGSLDTVMREADSTYLPVLVIDTQSPPDPGSSWTAYY